MEQDGKSSDYVDARIDELEKETPGTRKKYEAALERLMSLDESRPASLWFDSFIAFRLMNDPKGLNDYCAAREKEERGDKVGEGSPGNWKDDFDRSINRLEEVMPGARGEIDANTRILEQHFEEHPELIEKMVAQRAIGQTKAESYEMTKEIIRVFEEQKEKERKEQDRRDVESGGKT